MGRVQRIFTFPSIVELVERELTVEVTEVTRPYG